MPFPNWLLQLVERRIGHTNFADLRDVHRGVNELLDRPPRVMLPERREIPFPSINAQGLQRGEHTPARLGDRRVFDKERVPDHLRLARFVQGPELVVRQIEPAKALCDQIVINEQLVDPSEQQLSESWIVEMRVDVIDWRGINDIANKHAQIGHLFGSHSAGTVRQ